MRKTRDVNCSVLTMQHSSGFPDYFARVECDGRTMEFFMSKSKGRVEYHVAELEWLFNGARKPHILDYDSNMPDGYAEWLERVSRI